MEVGEVMTLSGEAREVVEEVLEEEQEEVATLSGEAWEEEVLEEEQEVLEEEVATLSGEAREEEILEEAEDNPWTLSGRVSGTACKTRNKETKGDDQWTNRNVFSNERLAPMSAITFTRYIVQGCLLAQSLYLFPPFLGTPKLVTRATTVFDSFLIKNNNCITSM